MPDTPRAVDPITLEVVKNALASTADEMALVIMRSAYSPVVRDTLDYSTALCDRNGRVVAQGLTLAVQLGTFPTVMQLRAGRARIDRTAGRRLHLERPLRLRRPAPARPLRDQAGLRRRHPRGLGRDDGAPLRRRRNRAGKRRRARDRDLPGRAPDPALEAPRRRRREHDADAADRGEHPPAGARARRPAGADRSLPRRGARADGAARALRHRRTRLHGRAAARRPSGRCEPSSRACPTACASSPTGSTASARTRRRSRSASGSRSPATRC